MVPEPWFKQVQLFRNKSILENVLEYGSLQSASRIRRINQENFFRVNFDHFWMEHPF